MKVLITGATGFIGKELLKALEKDHSVSRIYVLAHRNQDFSLTKPLEVLRENDLTSFLSKLDKIIHLAQDPNYRAFPEKALGIFDTNVALTQKLLDVAYRTGCSQFLYFSSGSVYDLTKSPITENSPVITHDYYSFTKNASEQLCTLYSKHFQTTILRLFNPFGPNLGDKFMTRIMNQIKNAKPVFVYPGKDFKLNPVHLDDICGVTMSLLEHGTAGTFNLAGEETVTFRQLVSLLSELMNKPVNFTESPTANQLDMIASIEKLQSNTNYNFKVSLEEGLRRFIESDG
jgi:UDP-glucose 4-epimerase